MDELRGDQAYEDMVREMTARAIAREAERKAVNTERGANLETLADRLIARHIRIAVPDSTLRDQLVGEGGATYEVDFVEREMRCIAVVGAGASASVLMRSGDLARKLEAEFGRDEAELERLRLVNNLEEVTFEARLVALSKSPPAERKVREKIAEIYGVQFPSLLGYELLAHLLKHRFLDAIITFNFDELLDQSLDDELNANEYIKVISERDCADVVSDPGAPDYVPLYVKLHGTASEPESLRFTPQSYYALPPRILEIVKGLLRCDHCVIANIGSDLGSFDFQRLLRIPRVLELFGLSRYPVPTTVSRKIASERAAQAAAEERAARGDRRGCEPAGPQRVPSRRHPQPEAADTGWLLDCNAWEANSDKLLGRLTATIADKARADKDRLVDFRSALRHRALAELLGYKTVHRGWMDDPGWARREWTEYCRRRTILELAFAGAKARGLMSLVPLTSDRPARYFDRYRKRMNGLGDDWHTFCSAAGLVESEETPDILYSQEKLRRRPTNAGERPDRRLNEFDPTQLARHVLARVKNPHDEEHVELLKQTFDELQREADVEFHMRDDRVCSKAFKRPVTLPTATSLRAYTWLMLRGLSEEDEVHISSETGEWLRDETARELLSRASSIRALLAFDIGVEDLKEDYGDRLKIAVVDPWRHNRHMTLVCKAGRPTSAIYFARRLRAPVITAVYLSSASDAGRLKRLYDERWREVIAEYESIEQALEAGDVDRWLSFYAADAEWIEQDRDGTTVVLRGHDQIGPRLRELQNAGLRFLMAANVVGATQARFFVTARRPDGGETSRHVIVRRRGAMITRQLVAATLPFKGLHRATDRWPPAGPASGDGGN